MRTSFITDRNDIDAVIKACSICFVGITEADGSPYVIPMNFGYDGHEIILHSGPTGKHLSLLELSNKVCVTFCPGGKLLYQHPDVACSYSMDSKSVLCKGTVTFIEDLAEKELALNLTMKHYTDRSFKYSTPALRNVKIWRVRIDEITSKAFGQNFR